MFMSNGERAATKRVFLTSTVDCYLLRGEDVTSPSRHAQVKIPTVRPSLNSIVDGTAGTIFRDLIFPSQSGSEVLSLVPAGGKARRPPL